MTIYEWDFETVDEYGDVQDHNAEDKLTSFPKDTEGNLVLVRQEGSDAEGVTGRYWAYVKDGQLPEYFEDSTGQEVNIKVPKKYKDELAKWIGKS